MKTKVSLYKKFYRIDHTSHETPKLITYWIKKGYHEKFNKEKVAR